MIARIATYLFVLVLTSTAIAADSVTFVEDFERTNVGNWHFLPLDSPTFIASSGGNPGKYLTHSQTQWPWPVLRTLTQDTVYTGNYRELGVLSLGLDFQVRLTNAQPHPDFTMTIMLVHNNGTPGNTSDDTRVYFNSGESIPWPTQGWKSYNFDIPSQLDLPFGQLPQGWQFYDDPFGQIYANHTWREVMENVNEVWFVGINDPAGIGFLLNWISGADNIRITYDKPAVIGDLDGNGVVNGFDLLILLAEWGECPDPDDCPADLDGDGNVNGFDLLTLLSNWG